MYFVCPSTTVTNDIASNNEQLQLTSTSSQDNSFAPHATNFGAQPSTLCTQHEFSEIPRIWRDNKQSSDFSDDDSVADPDYVPDLDNGMISRFLDTNDFCENILYSNETSMDYFDNITNHL